MTARREERVLSARHPDVLPTAADGVGPLRPGPTHRHPRERRSVMGE
jgi:hypothetical protein